MKKNPHPILQENNDTTSVNEIIQPSSVVFLGEYFNLHTMQVSPITQSFIEREAKAIMQWSHLDDSLRITDYTDMKGYPPQEYYRWLDAFPVMKLAHEYAMRRIASRRELGAVTRRFSEKAISWTLGHYDPIYKQEMIEIIKLKEESIAPTDIKVVIEQIPALAVVEERKQYKLTPEQVAMKARQSTRQVRKEGAGPYIAKSNVKKASKKLKEKYNN